MRAFRMTDWGSVPSHAEVPEPVPGPGQVLVRVAGCGLCRSDLTMRQMPRAVGERLGWRMPFTLGHETAGWVAAPAADLAEGTAVALAATASCGRCWFCVRGLESGCPHGLTGRGYGRDGGLAEFVLADRRGVLPLGGLDLQALLARERAVVGERDAFFGELVQAAREAFGGAAVVDEHDRRAM